MNLFKRANNAANADYINFGGKQIEVPKLTIAKWKLLFDRIETLPVILLDVLSARNTPSFTATLVAALSASLDEVVGLVAVLTELDPAWIDDNVTHDELIEFLTKTAQKNNLQEAAKKFRAALEKWAVRAGAAPQTGPSPSASGSSTAPSN